MSLGAGAVPSGVERYNSLADTLGSTFGMASERLGPGAGDSFAHNESIATAQADEEAAALPCNSSFTACLNILRRKYLRMVGNKAVEFTRSWLSGLLQGPELRRRRRRPMGISETLWSSETA